MNIEKLEKLNNLKEKGIITEEEFEIQKKKIFSEQDNNVTNSNGEDKSIWRYFVECITTKYCSFAGRARRKEFFGFALFRFLFGMIAAVLLGDLGIVILGVLLLLPDLGVLIRRIHDAGFSAWWVTGPYFLLGLVLGICKIYDIEISGVGAVFVFIIYLSSLSPLIFIFFDSEKKENKYGAVPEGVLK